MASQASLAAWEFWAGEFPQFRIWRETIGERTRYIARSRDLATRPHTLVTGDISELRATLTQSIPPAPPAPSARTGSQ